MQNLPCVVTLRALAKQGGVQVGHTLMRVDLDEGWEERLRNALELLVAAQNEKEAVEA